MASLQSYFPKWLLDSKDHVSQTKEWSLFLGELHEAIQQQLTESHVQFFTDLSGPEKTLFMERAIRAIETGGVFRNLFSRVSVLLDQHLNEDVARALMEDRVTDTKTDLVVAAAEEGAVSLLRRWPEMRSKLHICLNQPLPKALRTLGWKLFLSNTKIRKHYADVMSKNPRQAVSTFDLEISQKCEHLLNSEPTFSQLKGSVGGFYAMKAVLSYHQSRLHSQSRLPDIDYMLMVPFVLVSSDQLSRREPADGKIVAQLVEEYLSFMDSRPGYMVDSGSENHNTRVHGFVEKVTEQIEAQEPELAKALAKNFLPSKEKIITTETAGHQVFVDGLKSLIRPVLRAMFVGYLNADTLLYIWDQYMIGLDTPGFADDLLPVLVATFFVLLRDNLQECQSLGSVESVLRSQGVKLTVAQFQYQIKTTRYTDLYRLLEKDNKAAIPVLDPTQGRESPWRHWFNDVIPSYTRPQDRRRAREQREADRERLQRQQMEAENLNKEQEERDRRVAEEETQRLAEEERERANQERGHLKQLLEQEKRSREEAALRYQEEIEKLRLEIGALRGQQKQQRPQTNQSLASSISRVIVPPPPPSLASRVTSRPRLAEDTPHSPATRAQDVSPVAVDVPTPPTITSPVGTPQEQTEDAILDFFRRIHHSVNKIGHGESRERAELDEDTRDGLRAHVRDVKRAEMEIFNRNLEENEFSRLSPSTQKEASDRMMELIQQYRGERAGPPRRGRRR